MLRYLLNRILWLISIVLAATVVVFAIIHLAGDPTNGFVEPGASPEVRAQIRHNLGLDDPLAVQYVRFLGHAATGDFGTSWRADQPAMPLVIDRLGPTLLLAGAALTLAVLDGVQGEQTDAGIGEDTFDDDRTADQEADLNADEGEDWSKTGPECMAQEDSRLGQTLAPRGADEVGSERLPELSLGEAGDHRRRLERQRDRGQDQSARGAASGRWQPAEVHGEEQDKRRANPE